MQDQRQLWEEAHAKGKLHPYSIRQTSFAEQVVANIPNNGRLLELGCGEGNDAIYFAKQGYTVLATDFSANVISRNRKELTHPGLQFSVLDIRKPLGFPDNTFEVIYARLSLHYFTDHNTKKIFEELARVLLPSGHLCFMCKSVDDALYGQGAAIENDMFEIDGHVRHFFSDTYACKLLDINGFATNLLEKSEDKLYDQESAFIKVIAQKL